MGIWQSFRVNIGSTVYDSRHFYGFNVDTDVILRMFHMRNFPVSVVAVVILAYKKALDLKRKNVTMQIIDKFSFITHYVQFHW